MQFDWDDGNTTKCQKHGMTIPEIEAFFRARPRVAPDPAHSVTEQRHIAVGRATGGRPAMASAGGAGKSVWSAPIPAI